MIAVYDTIFLHYFVRLRLTVARWIFYNHNRFGKKGGRNTMRCTFKPLGCTAKTGTLFAAVCIAASVSATSAGTAVSNGVKWVDGRMLPLEGRCFDDVDSYYDRFPGRVSTNINAGVWKLKSHTAGMQFRFRTDSRKLIFRWMPTSASLAADHMPATGQSGIDVYRRDGTGRWHYVKTGFVYDAKAGGILETGWTPGDPCLVNLPLYNGIREFTVGMDTNATFSPLGPRASGISRPVVFYGTSITQGGCASRPGMAFVNIVGRDLDVPVCNLGFSGAGRMELGMAGYLARIDASCYVLDCLRNMGCLYDKPGAAFQDMAAAGYDLKAPTKKQDPLAMVRFRYEPFVRALRAKRPDVPIVMAGRCDVFCDGPDGKDKLVRELYEKLKAEGWKNLFYLPKDEMYSGDCEGTVDGGHPNDLGMMSMAKAFGKAVREALGLRNNARKE